MDLLWQVLLYIVAQMLAVAIGLIIGFTIIKIAGRPMLWVFERIEHPVYVVLTPYRFLFDRLFDWVEGRRT